MSSTKNILFSMQEIIITYILQYIIIFILSAIYILLGYKDLTSFINNYCSIFLIIYYLITTIYLFNKHKVKEKSIKVKDIYHLISIGVSIAIILNMIIFKVIGISNTSTIFILIAFLASGVVGPIYEEILFRYIFLNRLRKYYSNKKSIIINTIIFALIHLNPVNIIYAFFLGLAINLTYNKYENIIAPIIVHMAANSIVLLLSNFSIYLLFLSILLLLLNIQNILIKSRKRKIT